MPVDGIELPPGAFILCCTLETVAPAPCERGTVQQVEHRAHRVGAPARRLIDPGFCGQLTLEFKNVAPWPILLVPGRRYMQMVVYDWWSRPPATLLADGRYQNQQGATPAKEVQP